MDVALNDAGTRVMLFKNTSPRRPWICITPQVVRVRARVRVRPRRAALGSASRRR